MSKKPFDKFINKPESGAKKREKIRQEKKKVRAEKNAYFDEQKKLAWERRTGKVSADKPQRSKEESNSTRYRSERPASRTKDTGKTVDKKTSFASEPGKSRYRPERATDKPKAFDKRARPDAPFDKKRSPGDSRKPSFENRKGIQKQNSTYSKDTAPTKPSINHNKSAHSKQAPAPAQSEGTEDQMPLNKFIAWSGVCGRREAADLVKAGKVTVNDKLVTDPPHRVSQKDTIKVNGKKISIQKNLVYILLNKPKDYLTTTDDPEGRKTVMDLVKKATTERIFPVGRLDRNTTGVLLLTNDGEVAQRLTHPKYEVKKIYEVRLDKAVTKQQLDTIASGITLEDGFIQPDMVAYADAKDKSIIGIEIHSGRNRIVRRIFEHLGFDVKNLDRVMYGIFTKKNVERGKWRILTEKEIRLLKHLNTSFKNKKPS
jgi:23S rRNA pseudouridine2605 synthase